MSTVNAPSCVDRAFSKTVNQYSVNSRHALLAARIAQIGTKGAVKAYQKTSRGPASRALTIRVKFWNSF
jgi:hypothetical protein